MTKAVWMTLLSLPVIGIGLYLRRQWIAYQWREQPNYVDAIASWKPTTEQALALPPIRAMKAQRVNEWRSRRYPQRGRA